jgi:hypothetical protein
MIRCLPPQSLQRPTALRAGIHVLMSWYALQVSNLMHIYSSLNDADALLGVAALRQQGPTNADWICAAQKVGRWNDVESLYELETRAADASPDAYSAMQRASSLLRSAGRVIGPVESTRSCVVPSLTAAAAEDLLRCSMLAGKYQTVVSVADSWVSGAQGPQALAAGAVGVAASWRLGNWAAVDRFLKVRPCTLVCVLSANFINAWRCIDACIDGLR